MRSATTSSARSTRIEGEEARAPEDGRRAHLSVTPSGGLLLKLRSPGEPAGDAPEERAAKSKAARSASCDAWLRRVQRGFASSQAAGLFALAATQPDLPPSRSLSFWRGFAGRCLAERCRTPEGAALEPLDPPTPAELATLLLSAPPMEGAEYLSQEVLRSIWSNLDAWMRSAAAAYEGGFTAWLKRHAPMWHQVGRVCFHLAENRDDPDYPFAFLATYATRLSSAGRPQYQPLSRALQESARSKDRRGLVKLLAPVQAASQRNPWVKDLIDSGDLFHPLRWTPAEAYRFLKAAADLEESGLILRCPDWWRARPRAQVKITIGDKKRTRLDKDTLLDFRLSLAIGDQEISPAEWEAIAGDETGLVRVGGQWVEVDRDRLAEALDHWKRVEAAAKDGEITFAEGMRLLAGAPRDLAEVAGDEETVRRWSTVSAGQWFTGVLAQLRDPATVQAARPGRTLRGTLRPYQAEGHKWLWFLTRLGLGACLADDMGLGKTIQVLALLLSIKASRRADASRPSLLVLPASLLANWKAEINRFAPSLRTRFVHPSESKREELADLSRDPERMLDGIDLALTTYGMTLRQRWLSEMRWHLVVLDEAQAIKNPGARQTKAIKKLQADARIALTGTPVENRLGDLWSLFDFLCPGLLGTPAKFKRFVKSLERNERDRYAPLRTLVRPYILRRLKTDRTIITDLPEKTEMKVFCGLARAQGALYARQVRELSVRLQEVEGIDRRGLILAYLLRFKQICNHPSQFLGTGTYEPTASGKLERLRALCEEIASRQEKALVFTQFREMTDPLAAFLAEVFGHPGMVLHGGVAVRKRKALVDAFQREDGPPFFVLSIKAGGTGLNLTSATHVIHFDRWWNPAVETQATDRAFRIGQKRNVLVHKFICRGTVEEHIDALIEEKTAVANGILSVDGAARLTELSNDELLDVVSLDVDRAFG
ncbi:MAG: ATP-dependent helicase [Candidatus Eisenbacteria bacterium]|nr:ATP-dependent helicase [Candidatus Eisenbacteria bacterium]